MAVFALNKIDYLYKKIFKLSSLKGLGSPPLASPSIWIKNGLKTLANFYANHWLSCTEVIIMSHLQDYTFWGQSYLK